MMREKKNDLKTEETAYVLKLGTGIVDTTPWKKPKKKKGGTPWLIHTECISILKAAVQKLYQELGRSSGTDTKLCSIIKRTEHGGQKNVRFVSRFSRTLLGVFCFCCTLCVPEPCT
jgi:hypothetical protein